MHSTFRDCKLIQYKHCQTFWFFESLTTWPPLKKGFMFIPSFNYKKIMHRQKKHCCVCPLWSHANAELSAFFRWAFRNLRLFKIQQTRTGFMSNYRNAAHFWLQYKSVLSPWSVNACDVCPDTQMSEHQDGDWEEGSICASGSYSWPGQLWLPGLLHLLQMVSLLLLC